MAKRSKAREEGLVRLIGFDVDMAVLEKLEAIAQFLGITKTEMAKRILFAAVETPLNNEIWQLARKERVRKIWRDPKQKSQSATH